MPPARKATASQGRSPDPQSAKPGKQLVPVQTVPGQQPLAIFLRLAFSLEGDADQILDDKSIPDGVSGSSAGSSRSPGSQDGTEAPRPPLSAVAFSMNLQDTGSLGQNTDSIQSAAELASQTKQDAPAFSMNPQKVASRDQNTGPLGQNRDSVQGGQPSRVDANPAAGNGESSPSDTGSHHSGAEADKRADLTLEMASETKQDAPAEIQPLTGSPVQGLGSTQTSSGSGFAQARGTTTADTRPVAPPETPEVPVPASARQIDLTVPNDAGRQVDIRISQRGGDVQVTVRTPDSDLAQSLRHNLPELSETLSRNGLREDVFHTAQSHSAGDGNSGETAPDRGQQNPQDQKRAPARSRSSSQQTGSFAEIIHEEKRST